MYDFDELVAEVLKNKPDISRDTLMGLIQEKKRTVGSGYLTDQGALFLVAGELGVKLQHMITADLTLKDLHIGANDITVVARVLAVYPVAEFRKKDGSGVGRYRRVNLFDRNGIGRLTIWEDNEEAMKLSSITVDTPVRVVSAYVKQGLDGKPTVNLGKRGRIEVITDSSITSKLASLSELSKRLDSVQEGEVLLAVEGVTSSESRRSTFVRRDDNSNGSLTQFELKGPAGGKTTRVVIWDAGDLPAVRVGSSVRVTNLRHKKGRQGEPELHGDGATVIQVLKVAEGGEREGGAGQMEQKSEVRQVPQVPQLVKVAEVTKHAVTGSVSLEVMALSNGSVREVSLKDRSTAKKGEVVLGDDTGEITAVSWDEASSIVEDIRAGETLRVYGATVQISKMGRETLELTLSSKLERLQGR
jgi:ssDNA-binding replication factor A large subunit